MADFSDIQTTEQFQAVLSRLNDQIEGLQKQLAGAHTGLSEGAIRWNAGQNRWEKYDGSSWNLLASLHNMNVSQLQGYQTSTGATANTIALRDAAGRLKAAAPSAATDVVRKTELDAHSSADDNPHSVTKAQVGLGNVSNDQQLVRASNLADLPSAETARDNLELGSAATRDVGTSAGNLVLYENIPQPGNASTSQAGLTEYATTAEHQSGASDRAATPAGVLQMGFVKESALFNSSRSVTNVRSNGTTYSNSNALPRFVTVSFSNVDGVVNAYVNGTLVCATNNSENDNFTASFMVPSGNSYRVSWQGADLEAWTEVD